MRRVIAAACTALVLTGIWACGETAVDPGLPKAASALAPSVCSPITYGGQGRPRVLVPLVGPFQGALAPHGVQNAQAVRLVLEQRDWKAGGYSVGTQSCDEATSGKPSDPDKCAANARSFAANPSVLAVVGPSFSSCAAAMIPILNRAPGGPVPLISATNTYVGLTRGGPGVVKGHPGSLYPTGVRNYLRTVPPDDAQAAALVVAGQRAGVRRAFVLHDGEIYGDGLAGSFTAAARRSGLAVAGQEAWNPKARSFARLAARVRAAGADGVLLAGLVTSNGPRLISDLRAAMPRVALLAPDGFNQPTTIVEGAGARAEGLVVSIASGPVRTLPPAGQRWAAAFKRRTGTRPCCFATHTGQVMQLVLNAIAASDGSREDVLDRLHRTGVRDGLLGDFRFDRFGDTTQSTIALYRIEAGHLRYLQSIDVPPRLLTRE